MPKETAEEFANRILKGMGFDLDLIGDAPGHVAADIRARDREAAEEALAKYSIAERVPLDPPAEDRNYNPFEPDETNQQMNDRVGRMIRDNVDKRKPPAEDKVCLTCGGKHRMVAPCPDCHGTGRQRAQSPKADTTCEQCGRGFNHYYSDAPARFDFCSKECDETYRRRRAQRKGKECQEKIGKKER